MSRRREIHNNHAAKRGIVKERDGENQRVKVQFPDEDETVSSWFDIISKGSSKNADFDMPDLDDEVWCALDPAGEGGRVLGTRYNSKERPKETNADKKRRDFADGSFITHDPETGAHTIDISGTLVLKVGGSSITITAGGVDIQGPRIDLN